MREGQSTDFEGSEESRRLSGRGHLSLESRVVVVVEVEFFGRLEVRFETGASWLESQRIGLLPLILQRFRFDAPYTYMADWRDALCYPAHG